MELVALNKNIVNLNWLSGKILLWLFIILATLNLSTGAIIVLVAAGPTGEVLEDASNIPASNIRLLHLELFGGIVHLHPNTPTNSSQPSLKQKPITNPVLLRAFNALISEVATNNAAGNLSFLSQNNNVLSVEKPDSTGLKSGDKIITSSEPEPGLARTFSPTFQDPEKVILSFYFDKISHPVSYNSLTWPDIFLYPPEKPPQPSNQIISA